MQDINLRIDKKSSESISALMKHYNVTTEAALISKAVAVLKTAAFIELENGELFARRGDKETKIIIR